MMECRSILEMMCKYVVKIERDWSTNMEFENLLKLIHTVSDSKLTRFKYEENGAKISLSKESGKVQTIVSQGIPSGYPAMQDHEGGVLQGMPETTDESKTIEEESGQIVTAPLVGIFYSAPAEDAEPFVKAGDKVTKGQTLAIIEAMKLMNEIESDYAGTIVEVLVENGQAVEYGQPLFCIVT